MEQRPLQSQVSQVEAPTASVNGAGSRPVTEGAVEGGGVGGGGGGGGRHGGNITRDMLSLGTFSSLKNPVFRLYFGSMAGWMAAANSKMVARSLLIYLVSGSATVLGLMALANSIPMFFFSLYGGVLADRAQKKHVLLVGILSSFVIAVATGLCITFGFLGPEHPDSWWILIVAALAEGTVMGLMLPSRQAVIGEIVGQEQLMNAVALGTLEMNLNRMLMPALGGFFIDAFGFDKIYYLMAGMYLVSAMFMVMMPRTSTIAIKGRGTWGEMKDGFSYVRTQPTIMAVLIITFFIVLLSTPYMSLLPIFTKDILNVGAGGFGTLVSVSGIGALLGSLVMASLPNKWRGALLILGSVLLGVALTAFSFSTAWRFSLFMMLFVGLGQSMRMTLGNTLLQYYVTNEYRGRVMSLYMMEFGLTSLGTFFAAVFADVIGVQWSVGGLAMLLVVISVLTFFFVPRLRKLD
ncbi:MAG: MFS transporter [Dehalococcoidia bacterium]|nr:MFS transporter [Dehalococcoidia bacterium]